MRTLGAVFFAVMFGAASAYAQTPAAALPMAIHKALYDFKLVAAEAGTGVTDIKGKMYYEQDDTCDAWTTDHRFTTQYNYADREPETDASHYVAYEAKDGSQFSFSSEREQDGDVTEQLRGSVEIAPNGSAKAIYARPDDLKYNLPKGYFLPNAHTAALIRHARAGDHFFRAVMFDGTDADGPVEVSAFIGKKLTRGELKKLKGKNKKINADLLSPDAWHIRMAVFPLKDADEMAPAYEMDMIQHDNGVVSYALIDYKTFRIEQRLTALEKLKARKCG